MKSLLLLFSLLFAISVFAKVPEPQKNTHVNDYAHVLSKKQIILLNNRIKAFTRKTNTKLTVILVNRIPDEYTIKEYASKIAIPDSSLLYVMAIKDEEQCLVSDYSLQFIVATYFELALDNLKPRLSQRRYASTIYNFIETVEQHITNTRTEEQKELAEREASNKVANETVMNALKGMARLTVIIMGIVISFSVIVWLFMRFSSRKKTYTAPFINTKNMSTDETNLNNHETISVVNSSASRSTSIDFTPVNDFGEHSNRGS